MRCGQCVNCQNPQRKRPCVLARRRLLELLRAQEGGAGGASPSAGTTAGDGCEGEGAGAPAASASGYGCGISGVGVGGGESVPTSPRAPPSGPPSLKAAAAALHIPTRKLLFPVIPPSQRCGQCGPCLNPRLKKACKEARRRQMEAGLALPGAQVDMSGLGAREASAAAAAAAAAGLGGGVGGKRATAAATAAAVQAARALGPALVGCRVRIYWDGMRRWYEGRVAAYTRTDG